MGIGTSLGAFFETEFDHHTGNELNMDTRDNNEFTLEGDHNQPDPAKIIPVSDIKTASPLVTITDEDIDKGINLGLSFSGGGLSTNKVITMRKAANDNVKLPDNSEVTAAFVTHWDLKDQISHLANKGKLSEFEQIRLDKLIKEHEGLVGEKLYNPREPNMVGSKEMDLGIDKAWERFRRGNEIIEGRAKYMDILKDRNLNDLERHKFNKLNKEHDEHFGGYSLD